MASQLPLTLSLVIEGTFPWYRGGVSEWICHYLEYFRTAHFHIIQISTDDYAGYELTEGVYPVPENVKSFTRINPPEDLTDPKKWTDSILDRLPRQPANFIHVLNTGLAGLAGLALSKRDEIPLILTEHGVYWKEIELGADALECGYRIPSNPTERHLASLFFQSIAREVYKNSSMTFSVSVCNQVFQAELGAQNSTYIPNGVPSSMVSSVPEFHPVFDDPVIGWVGRCAHLKNPHRFLDLVEKWSETEGWNPRFIMLLADAGEADLNEEVKLRLSQIPTITAVWNQPASSYFDKMDALCLTSISEAQPLVMLEAMARGVVPFGWEAGDFNESFGISFPKESGVQDVLSGFLPIISDSDRWLSEQIECHNKIVRAHTWPVIFGQYEHLFQEFSN